MAGRKAKAKARAREKLEASAAALRSKAAAIKNAASMKKRKMAAKAVAVERARIKEVKSKEARLIKRALKDHARQYVNGVPPCFDAFVLTVHLYLHWRGRSSD